MSAAKPGSRWGLMGNVVRRASTMVAISRPGTPSSQEARDSDSDSLTKQKIDTTPLVPPSTSGVPVSPINESPAREAASVEAAATIGPSPLTQDTSVTNPGLVQAPEELQTSPTGYIPPPLVDSTIGNPGAFTDDTDSLPQTAIAVDPFAPIQKPADGPATEPADLTESPVNEEYPSYFDKPYAESIKPVEEPNPAFAEAVDGITAITEPAVAGEHVGGPEAGEVPVSIEAKEQPGVTAEEKGPEATAQEVERGNAEDYPSMPGSSSGEARDYQSPPFIPEAQAESYGRGEPINASAPAHGEADDYTSPPFIPIAQADEYSRSGPTAVPGAADEQYRSPPFIPEAQAAEYGPSRSIAAPQAQRGLADEFYNSGPSINSDAPRGEADNYYSIMPVATHESGILAAAAVAAPILALPSYDMHSGSEVWGGEAPKSREGPFVGSGNGHASQGPNVSMPSEDPFADPAAPRITITNNEGVHMPYPYVSEQHQQGPSVNREDVRGVIMPLPALHDVIPSKSLHQVPSVSSFTPSGRKAFEVDESRPLLSDAGTSKHRSYLASSRGYLEVSPQSPSHATSLNAPRLHELGWLEYHLPDGTFYYVHPTRRITTDINLRVDKLLNAITEYFENSSTPTPSGIAHQELWLRDAGTAKKGFVPLKSWVDHHARTVTSDKTAIGKGKKVVEEDQLDMEFRYWSFMEAHPAHTALPAKARSEAMDVLTWAWTDRLLPSHRAIPSPFSQDECQELMTLLRSFNTDKHDDLGIQTRIVSRILLRVARWRQTYFRPNKPLPKDVSGGRLQLPTRSRPFRRVILDFVVSCICLGVPYLFLERSRNSRIDEESGMRNAGPALVIGACTCLVAAIVLSASVTFLSLPGLDSIARIAGFVAILFASFSMASTLVAIFRHKADMDTISHLGGEGLVITRRTLVMSLPIVFLAYSIIGFITGIVLYSIRGVTFVDPHLTQSHFGDYTKWTVTGLGGALAGILTMSLLLLRR